MKDNLIWKLMKYYNTKWLTYKHFQVTYICCHSKLEILLKEVTLIFM
jgi:hypothetical protein